MPNLSLDTSFKEHPSTVGPFSILANKRLGLSPIPITKFPSRFKLKSITAVISYWNVSLGLLPALSIATRLQCLSLWFIQKQSLGSGLKMKDTSSPYPTPASTHQSKKISGERRPRIELSYLFITLKHNLFWIRAVTFLFKLLLGQGMAHSRLKT